MKNSKGHILGKSLKFQLHWHLNKFYERRTLNSADLPASVGHFFEKEITKFLAEETDEDKQILKTGFCDWFWKWELVDTGVSDLKKQVKILIQLYFSLIQSYPTPLKCI